jgi:ABC-type branched-subunit amino acid transport system ATPase component
MTDVALWLPFPENLEMGPQGFQTTVQERLNWVFSLFHLTSRRSTCGTLSGGEQQMVSPAGLWLCQIVVDG